MTREEFIKQRCEIDKITEEEFEKRYRVVKCNCGQPYCKGYRCLDLNGLLKENQELKKQLEEINKLNNVINELEKWLNNQTMISLKYEIGYYKEVLDKLKELKENKYEIFYRKK